MMLKHKQALTVCYVTLNTMHGIDSHFGPFAEMTMSGV